jgi:spore germination cell wall hydrolase CwlJ-like protein
LLGRVTYAEAAGQYNIPYAMEGVASTVSNRVNSNKSYFGGNTYEEVIYSGQYASVGCETCYRWNEFVNPSALKGSASAGYSRSLEVAEGVYSGTIPDPTNGATYFHSYTLTELQKESPWFYNSIQNGRIQPSIPKPLGPFYFYK